jgi:hypothetical protein
MLSSHIPGRLPTPFSFCPKDDRLTNRDAGDGKQFYFFSPSRFICTTLKKRSRTIDDTSTSLGTLRAALGRWKGAAT